MRASATPASLVSAEEECSGKPEAGTRGDFGAVAEAQGGVTLTQPRRGGSLAKLRGQGQTPSVEPQEGASSAHTWISDFWPEL